MHKYKEIEITIRNGLQIIKLNRPQKKNAMNTLMYGEVQSALDDAKNNKAVTIAALTGAGDYYSSGNDLSSYTVLDDMDSAITQGSKRVNSFVSSFIHFPKILVAVVNGPAIGVAATTLGLCDVVYASDKATFHTPFTASGLSAEGCSSYTFPRIMGTSMANEMLLFNRKISAQEAKECGFVAEVIKHDNLDSVWPRLEKYAALPMQSMHSTKRLVHHFDLQKLQEVNDNECKQLEERWKSEEFMNAVLQFFQRGKTNKEYILQIMHKYKDIEVTVTNGLQIIKLNRPQKKNAISTLMYDEIQSALEDARNNKAVTVTALTGAGDYYSSGTDLSNRNSLVEDFDSAVQQNSKRLNSFVSSFIHFPKILVAVVNGPAIGIAATTLGLCDVVYASDKATFHTPFTASGLSAEGCSSYTFPQIMGTSMANEMLLFNRKISAQEAKECGFVAEVIKHGNLDSVWPRLEKYAALPMQSMYSTKQLVHHFDLQKLQEVNDNECKQLEERWKSEEFMNAVLKFFQRRSKI